jgi:Protein of unknown function (DUF4231)
MDPDDYIANRLDDQISWYSRKSQWNKQWLWMLRTAEIFFAGLIPFLANYGADSYSRSIVGLMGVAVAVIAGAISLFKFHENWIEYRTTAESLKHEKYLFLTSSNVYVGPDAFHLLVERTETLISKENTSWSCHAAPVASDEARNK